MRWNLGLGKQSKAKTHAPEQWKPPALGTLKLNTDGSWVDGASTGSVAGVCSDSSGALVAGFAEPVQAASALTTEALAVHRALLYLLEKVDPPLLEDTKVEMETDDRFVAEIPQGKEESPWAWFLWWKIASCCWPGWSLLQ
ncbi:hypothetical protein NL676_029557 [Syzygium grande]|nr:hypothetical protein NL676_029557 [Syzygium grande]